VSAAEDRPANASFSTNSTRFMRRPHPRTVPPTRPESRLRGHILCLWFSPGGAGRRRMLVKAHQVRRIMNLRDLQLLRCGHRGRQLHARCASVLRGPNRHSASPSPVLSANVGQQLFERDHRGAVPTRLARASCLARASFSGWPMKPLEESQTADSQSARLAIGLHGARRGRDYVADSPGFTGRAHQT